MQPSHEVGERPEEPIDVILRRRRADAHPEPPHAGEPDLFEDGRGILRTAAAGRAGADVEAAVVQGHRQRRRVQPVDHERDQMRRPVRRVTEHRRPPNFGGDPFTDRSFDINNLSLDYALSDRDIRHKFNFFTFAQLGWGIEGNFRIQARSAQPITPATRTDPHRGTSRYTELVPGEGEEVRAQRRHVDRQPAHRLARVRVEAHAGFPGEPGRLGHLLQRSELVVGVLQARQERAGAADLNREAVEVRPPRPVRRDHRDLEPIGVEHAADPPHGGVFDGAHDDPVAQLAPRSCGSPDREGDRLGAARREDDLIGLRSHFPTDRHPCVVDDRASRAGRSVDRQGVAECAEGLDHRSSCLRAQRRRRCGVQVDLRVCHGQSVALAPPGPRVSRGPVPGGRGTSRRCRR